MAKRNIVATLGLWLGAVVAVIVIGVRYGDSGLARFLTGLTTIIALAPLSKVWPLQWRAIDRPSTPAYAREAVEQLGWMLKEQWQQEVERRQLQNWRRIAVAWRREDIAGAERGQGQDPLPRTGELETLVSRFEKAPFRLIVTGDLGAGKTSLSVSIAQSLLSTQPPDRVPFVFHLSSWDFDHEKLTTWMARRLTEEHPFLEDASRYGSEVGSVIVSRQMMLPIFEGLDDLTPSRRRAVLQTIESETGDDQPWIVTCRTAVFSGISREYRIRSSQVVTLLPVTTDAAKDYLQAGATVEVQASWDPVFDEMQRTPDGPISAPLSNPLMLFLAHNIYNNDGADPAELLDAALFDSAGRVEEHLLDRYIPSVYDIRPSGPVADPRRPSIPWSPAKAERTLRTLARHLDESDRKELAWWELDGSLSRRSHILRGAALGGVSCGALGAFMFGLVGQAGFGLLAGVAVGITVGGLFRTARRYVPRRFAPRQVLRAGLLPEELLTDLALGVVGASTGLLIVGILYGATYGTTIGLLFGVVFAIVRRLSKPTEPREAPSPLGAMRSDRGVVLLSFVVGGVVGALVGGVSGAVLGAPEGLVVDVQGRVALSLLGTAVGLVMGGAGLGLVVYTTSAWSRLVRARIRMASRGLVPWRLMRFLDDANRLGVLRQVGQYYEFRHPRLQERLIASDRTDVGTT